MKTSRILFLKLLAALLLSAQAGCATTNNTPKNPSDSEALEILVMELLQVLEYSWIKKQ